MLNGLITPDRSSRSSSSSPTGASVLGDAVNGPVLRVVSAVVVVVISILAAIVFVQNVLGFG